MVIVEHDSSIRDFYDQLFTQAAAIVASGEEHLPIMIVLHETRGAGIIVLSHLSKEKQAASLKAAAKSEGVIVAVLICECWYVDLSANQDGMRPHPDLPPSEHPDRKESILFNVLTPMRQAVMNCPIDRNSNTVKKVDFAWLDELEGEYYGRYIRETGQIENNRGTVVADAT